MLKLHHISIAVNNVDEALETYRDMLGLTVAAEGVREVPEFGVKAAVLTSEDLFSLRIELAEPIAGTESRYGLATRDFLRERGEGIFRFAMFTDDFDARVKALEEKGYPMIVEEYSTLFPGYKVRIAFFRPEYTRGVWMNLVDEKTVPRYRGGQAP